MTYFEKGFIWALPRRYSRLRSVYSLTLVAFAAKTAARLRTYFYVPPKLVNARHASKPQTIRQLHSGVARCCHEATSERGRGWAGYLPSSHNARSEASEHAIALVAIPRQDPLHRLLHFGARFCSGCTTRAFGAPFNTYRAKTRRKVYCGF